MTATTPSEYVVLSKTELDFREWEIILTWLDVEALIEHRELFKKFLMKSIHKIQSDLWMLKYTWREAEAVLQIETIRQLMKSLDKTLETYRSFIDEQEKKKE